MNATNDFGGTPLLTSARETESPKQMKLLIAAGANVNARDSEGENGLHQLAWFGYPKKNVETARILFEAGAEIRVKNSDGKTPLDILLDNSFSVLVFAVVLCAGFRALGRLSAHDFSDKTVAQLLNLLEDKDRAVRVDAALYLGYRYRKPGIEINPPTYKAQHPEFPLPSQVVPRLSKHLKFDSDYGVRIEAMRALRDLMSCTNTTSIAGAWRSQWRTNCAAFRFHRFQRVRLANQYSESSAVSLFVPLRLLLFLDHHALAT